MIENQTSRPLSPTSVKWYQMAAECLGGADSTLFNQLLSNWQHIRPYPRVHHLTTKHELMNRREEVIKSEA